ncbi:MAG: ferredoxin-nitrate reductase NarB [Phormidesmis priestleyi Ana]|uniref:Ferredoxin-nitrate reductase NarB n=1 Tax=Phormidesmis priestleyi Ana TaxID=1666911 RepID=A0A0P8DFC4_9CYAN|nr:MAG: ferredoxin-nitrate reductase NarB [Phormidesmis priestleyi Ana]
MSLLEKKAPSTKALSAKTLCPYCGVGCGLEVFPPARAGRGITRDPDGKPVWQAVGDRAHPSSKGQVCIKGASIGSALDRDRLKVPMMRESLDQPFQAVSWEEAFSRITAEIQQAIAQRGPNSICMYGSGQFQTEDYYIAQKLMKGCIGTNNFDANSRLCMSSAVAGYIQSFGSDGPPCCYDDLEETDCAFLIGTNTAECHPIVFNRLKKHHKKNKNVKLIVVDPRRTQTAKDADLHLAIKPGSDIALLHGMAYLILRANKHDAMFIDYCTDGFASYVQIVNQYPPERVAQMCGIPQADIEKAAQMWMDSKRVLSLWSMGINQSTEGTAKCRTIINLHLMTGQIGHPGAGPFSLTGQPNAMGGREAGGLAHILPGYRLVKNPDHRRVIEKVWQLPEGSISPEPGLAAWDMMLALEREAVGVMWIAATNPAVSMPDIKRTQAALLKSPFTICQDAYYPTETAAYAHVVLPAAQWGEATGVMTNSERVVTLCPAFRAPVGKAKADWEIFAEVGRRLGFEQQFNFKNSAEVYDEFVGLTADRLCDMSGLSHERLAQAGPIQWPIPVCETAETAATKFDKRLYTDHQFLTDNGRAQFATFHAKGLAEPPDDDFPMVMTTGRLLGHWHTQTRTGRIEKIAKKYVQPVLEVNPKDAQRLQVQSGDWVEVRSRRGFANLPILVTQNISRGTVFMPMHWGFLWGNNAEVNALTHPEVCPISLEPELKACAVQLTPIAPQPATTALSTVQQMMAMVQPTAAIAPHLPNPTESTESTESTELTDPTVVISAKQYSVKA